MSVPCSSLALEQLVADLETGQVEEDSLEARIGIRMEEEEGRVKESRGQKANSDLQYENWAHSGRKKKDIPVLEITNETFRESCVIETVHSDDDVKSEENKCTKEESSQIPQTEFKPDMTSFEDTNTKINVPSQEIESKITSGMTNIQHMTLEQNKSELGKNEAKTEIDIHKKRILTKGMIFPDFKIMMKMIQDWSLKNFSPIVIFSNHRFGKNGQTIYMICPHGAKEKISKSTGKLVRKMPPIGLVDCPVYLKLRKQSDESFRLEKAITEHEGHEVSRNVYLTYKETSLMRFSTNDEVLPDMDEIWDHVESTVKEENYEESDEESIPKTEATPSDGPYPGLQYPDYDTMMAEIQDWSLRNFSPVVVLSNHKHSLNGQTIYMVAQSYSY